MECYVLINAAGGFSEGFIRRAFCVRRPRGRLGPFSETRTKLGVTCKAANQWQNTPPSSKPKEACMVILLRRLLRVAIAVATLTIATPLFSRCGVERWTVKTGTDSDASQVHLTAAPTPTTISDLISVTPPHPIPKTRRVAPTETTVWTVDALLTDYKIEDSPTSGDSDYHLVLKDEEGNTMVAEIPSPDCVGPGSPFAARIRSARGKFDAKLTAGRQLSNREYPCSCCRGWILRLLP
jgi:hypothetical protein